MQGRIKPFVYREATAWLPWQLEEIVPVIVRRALGAATSAADAFPAAVGSADPFDFAGYERDGQLYRCSAFTRDGARMNLWLAYSTALRTAGWWVVGAAYAAVGDAFMDGFVDLAERSEPILYGAAEVDARRYLRRSFMRLVGPERHPERWELVLTGGRFGLTARCGRWLEPLAEVEDTQRRLLYKPVKPVERGHQPHHAVSDVALTVAAAEDCSRIARRLWLERPLIHAPHRGSRFLGTDEDALIAEMMDHIPAVSSGDGDPGPAV